MIPYFICREEQRVVDGPLCKHSEETFHKDNRWKNENISITNIKKTGGKDGRSQSPKDVVSSENPFRTQSNGRIKKRKRNVDEKPNIGNKRVQTRREKDDSNKKLHHASVASKPGRPSKFSKNTSKSRNYGPK